MTPDQLIKARDELADKHASSPDLHNGYVRRPYYFAVLNFQAGFDAAAKLLQEERAGLLEALEKTFAILDRIKPISPEPGSGAIFFTDKQFFDDRMRRVQDMVEAKDFIQSALAAHRRLEDEKGGEK